MENRYERQMLLKDIGEEGQAKLAAARVLVVGAGGLGSPVLYYLAGAGVGNIGIVDCDVASITNLNRQILHFQEDIDVAKVDSAYNKLSAFNPEIKFDKYNMLLDEDNIDAVLENYDIVVDCVDNLEARHLVNKHAVAKNMHVIEAGIEGMHGFVMTVKPGEACFGCLRPSAETKKRKIPVLGATAGVVGSVQALECIKVITGTGEPLYSKVLFMDLAHMSFDIVNIKPSEICPCCGQTAK